MGGFIRYSRKEKVNLVLVFVTRTQVSLFYPYFSLTEQYCNSLEWAEEVSRLLRSDAGVQVLVTILEEEPLAEINGRGQRMTAVLEKLAQAQAFAGIEPVAWQRDVRQHRELPSHNE